MSLKQIAIALDQLVNAILGGYPDETVSARAYRLEHRQPYKFLRPVIDGLFFWQDRHCFQSFMAEKNRMQSPKEEQ